MLLPEPATKRRLRLLPRTLSARLVAGVVALVFVVVTMAGAATYEALRSFLFNRLDQQLASTANPGAITSMLSNQRLTGRGLHGPQTVRIAVLDSTGTAIDTQYSDPDVEQLSLNQAQRTAALTKQHPYTLTTTNGVRVRVTVVPVNVTLTDLATGAQQQEAVTVVLGLPTSEVDNTLGRLIVIELAIGGGAVVLALIASAFGVRLSLKPLHRVTATARAVTAELSPEGAGLDRRVEISEAESDTEAGQMAESVNTLLSAVEEQFAARLSSEQRMRQFLADASHELRTPLTSIRGYAELSRMRRNSAPERQDPAADAETLDRIESEGTRMSRLVEDLLTLARGDQRSPTTVGPVEVEEIVSEAVYGARAAYPDRQIDIVTQPGLVVGGDHDQLLRVVRNLVTNACVHTAPGGPIRVTAARNGQWIDIQVIDSGPGLPPEHAAHVFERFWRADASRARNSGGSGLGLSIVESIVLAHGGTIALGSDVATGSTFTVRLPSIS